MLGNVLFSPGTRRPILKWARIELTNICVHAADATNSLRFCHSQASTVAKGYRNLHVQRWRRSFALCSKCLHSSETTMRSSSLAIFPSSHTSRRRCWTFSVEKRTWMVRIRNNSASARWKRSVSFEWIQSQRLNARNIELIFFNSSVFTALLIRHWFWKSLYWNCARFRGHQADLLSTVQFETARGKRRANQIISFQCRWF